MYEDRNKSKKYLHTGTDNPVRGILFYLLLLFIGNCKPTPCVTEWELLKEV
jgi:hypothetical protein